MIIEVDEYKNKIPGYAPSASELFHAESGKLADKDFTDELKTGNYRKVILMAGGTASGKTEFARSYLDKKSYLIYDGTLKNIDGFKVKLQRIKKFTKKVKIEVVLILAYDWTEAFAAFLGRQRKMEMNTFFYTQIKSKVTVAYILENTDITVKIYASSTESEGDKLTYKRVSLRPSRKKVATYLRTAAINLYEQARDVGIDLPDEYSTM